ncbi:hypothetical protein FOMPIDRAFT_94132 [Fomitopsis schrenkii]|uniref:Uncharacterized protein n=1 Tax=Fomitopsis schrenkii TaxID=2126942 RepID=S8ESX2_FOMSC|nr:hypothetical protein FOMPIDRAFT_94132 [Fomitopsis schrenkii]
MAHYVFSGHPRGKIYTTIKQELPDLDKAQRLVDDVEVLHQQCEAHEMMLDSLETDLASKDREIAHLTTRLNDLSSQLKLQKVINKETLLEKQEGLGAIAGTGTKTEDTARLSFPPLANHKGKPYEEHQTWKSDPSGAED